MKFFESLELLGINTVDWVGVNGGEQIQRKFLDIQRIHLCFSHLNHTYLTPESRPSGIIRVTSPILKNRDSPSPALCLSTLRGNMKGVRPVYKSYLLRLWKESNDGEWRVFLQNISTGECQNFSTLAALLEHLEHPASFVKNETKLPQEINRLA